MSERTITVIPATNAGSLPQIQSIARKKRVAAYARVSTDKEEQQNSYEAQVDYYTDYIQKNPEWAFIEVYADADTPYGLNPKSP